MGLWTAISRMNPDFLFISDDQVATTEQVRVAQLARLKEQAAARITDPETIALLEARASGIGYDNLAAEDSPYRTFVDTAVESIGKLPSGLTDLPNRFFRNLLGSIPWTVWLALALFIAWKLGWLKRLISRLV